MRRASMIVLVLFCLPLVLPVEEALAVSVVRIGSPSEGRDVDVVLNRPRRNRPTVLSSC